MSLATIISTGLIPALLDGRKTQTRRVIRKLWEPTGKQPDGICQCAADGSWIAWWGSSDTSREHWESMTERAYPDGGGFVCPYGRVGERLWVREAWQPARNGDTGETVAIYRADWERNGKPEGPAGGKWRPSIHLPRWASRITLEIAEVRVERLHNISAKDILAEGVVDRAHYSELGKCPVSAIDGCCYPDLKSLWAAGWDKINGKRAGCAWKDNPWLWAISFRRIEQRSDKP